MDTAEMIERARRIVRDYGPDVMDGLPEALLAEHDARVAADERMHRIKDENVVLRDRAVAIDWQRAAAEARAEQAERERDFYATDCTGILRADAAEARVADLEAALGFYANPVNYANRWGDVDPNRSAVTADNGDRARLALAGGSDEQS